MRERAGEPVRVDSRGEHCPIPVLKLRKALLAAPAGGRVLLLATDRQAWRDVPAFCAETGDDLVDQTDDNGTFRFLVEKAMIIIRE